MLPIKVPPLGESIVEATVSKWHKNEGDAVKVDEVLGEQDENAVGAAVSGERDAGARDAGRGMRDAVAPTAPPAPTKAATPPPAPSQSDTVKSSPAARRIADERGIDIAAVSGTGRGGVVSKPDVLAAGTSAPSAPKAPSAPAPPRGGNGATPGERETREKM